MAARSHYPAMAAPNAAVEGLSGALGGIVALVATYPLMTVRDTTYMRAFCCAARGNSLTAGSSQRAVVINVLGVF